MPFVQHVRHALFAAAFMGVAAPALAQPANDLCANATLVTDGSYAATTVNATATANLPIGGACGSSFTSPDAWFVYHSQIIGQVTVATCSAASYDTVLGIFTGSCGALQLVTCVDDSCSTRTTVSFDVVPQTDYLIRLGGFGNASGNATLTVSSERTITYQGQLNESGTPLDGTVDLRFRIFSVAVGGAVLGSPADQLGVAVTNGVFTAPLAINAAIADGRPLFLEVSLRSPPGFGTFTALNPRQPITFAPYALYADSASWAGLLDVPADFADGVDDTVLLAGSGVATTAAHSDHTHSSLAASDGNPAQALVVDNIGSVGVGTATPIARLHVSNGLSGGTVLGGSELLLEDDSSCYINLMTPDAFERGIAFGSQANAAHGGIYYTNTAGLSFRAAGNNTMAILNQNGNFSISAGNSNDATLHVRNSNGASRPIKCDRAGTDGELLAWARDDIVVGSVSVVGGTVTYGAFTGVHYATFASGEPAPVGALVTLTGKNATLGGKEDSEVVYGVTTCALANDPAALGVYVGSLPAESLGHTSDVAQVAAVGNGDVWVVYTGADIRPGDLLVSAAVPGCAMLDNPRTLPLGHVIARAAQTVEWSAIAPDASGVRKARVSVLFDRFTRSGNPAATAAEIESLRARLDRLESLLSASKR